MAEDMKNRNALGSGQVPDSAVLTTSRKLVETFASATDAFLQEFQEAVKRNTSVKDVVIATARLAQLGASMSAVFKAASLGAAGGPEGIRLANEICEQTHTMLQKRLDAILKEGYPDDGPDSEPALTGKSDGSLN